MSYTTRQSQAEILFAQENGIIQQNKKRDYAVLQHLPKDKHGLRETSEQTKLHTTAFCQTFIFLLKRNSYLHVML